MSVLTLNVDEARRTLSNSDKSVFVINDKNVDIVRFALLTGFTDIALDEHSALRVMYQRPGETQVRAQTLTYYDTDGIRNYYDWELLAADLAEKGTLTVALCILRTDSTVEEWHTTPYQIRVLGSIHTDDSDEGDESITPTVAQRVAVLETMIQRVASGAPIVVASTSAMTDTDQIYVLSTDGNWYYHNGSAWVSGGEYGAVATDTTLSQPGVPADAKAVGDEIALITDEVELFPYNIVDGRYLLYNGNVVTGENNIWCYRDLPKRVHIVGSSALSSNKAVVWIVNGSTMISAPIRGTNESIDQWIEIPDNATGIWISNPATPTVSAKAKSAKDLVSRQVIADGSITGAKIADGTITADKLSSDITFDTDAITTVTETIPLYPGGDDPEPTPEESTTNKINPNDPDALAGKYIKGRGDIDTKSNGTVSGYIPVTPGVWYSYHYLNTLGPGGVTFNLCNASKEFVDYWTPSESHERIKWRTDSNNHVYMAFKLSDTSTVRYVRVSLTTAAIGVYAMFVKGDTMPSEYIPYGESSGGEETTDPSVYTVERNALASSVANLGPKRIRLDMELGTFATVGDPSSAFSPLPSARRRTAFYIKTNGATSFSLLDLGLYDYESIILETFNAEMTFMSESSAITSPVNIPIASGVEYIKFVVDTEEKIRTLDAVFYGGIYAPEQVKNIQISTNHSDQMLFDITDETFGCARILLPSTYSVDGAPVPLILYAHGSGVMTQWNQEMFRYSVNKFFCDEGFALLEVFGWDNKDWTTYGQGTDGVDPYPIPYWIKMYEKAVEKACALYNIDRDNIHVLCKSQGGQLAYHYVSNPPTFPIRSVSMFAPVLDYLSMNGSSTSADSRRVLAREMEFEGNAESDYVGQNTYGTACSAFLSANIEKVNGLNEAWRGLVGQTLAEKFAASMDNGSKWWSNKNRADIYTDTDLCRIGFIPTKIWAATNDTSTPYRKSVEAVSQLNNGGTEAHMRLFDTGGHAINSATGPQTTNVTAANGTVWSTIPTCIYEAAQWMKSKMPHASI